MKDFYIFSKESLQILPPAVSLALAANRLGYRVVVVTQNINKELLALFDKEHIVVENLHNPIYDNIFLKLFGWYKFARFARPKYLSTNPDAIIWVTGANAAVPIGLKVLKKRDFYFQINELYDDSPVWLRLLKRVAPHAKKIIVPERNRAAIFQVWFGLSRMPSILFNKPYVDDSQIENKQEKYKEYIHLIELEKGRGKKILLYQGMISSDRNLSCLLAFANAHQKELAVVLMGHDYGTGMLDKYKSICPLLIHIPLIPAPFHLQITQHADIGIVVYLPISLNNSYCAPNKIWEYTRYGLALIGNNIPGLDVITACNLGVQIDFLDDTSVQDGMLDLIRNHRLYKDSSREFYQNYHFDEVLKDIIS